MSVKSITNHLSIPSSSRQRNMGSSSSSSLVQVVATSVGIGAGNIGRDDAGVSPSSSHVGLGCCFAGRRVDQRIAKRMREDRGEIR